MVWVNCECGTLLGRFESFGAHGGVVMECPECKRGVSIHNQELIAAEKDMKESIKAQAA